MRFPRLTSFPQTPLRHSASSGGWSQTRRRPTYWKPAPESYRLQEKPFRVGALYRTAAGSGDHTQARPAPLAPSSPHGRLPPPHRPQRGPSRGGGPVPPAGGGRAPQSRLSPPRPRPAAADAPSPPRLSTHVRAAAAAQALAPHHVSRPPLSGRPALRARALPVVCQEGGGSLSSRLAGCGQRPQSRGRATRPGGSSAIQRSLPAAQHRVLSWPPHAQDDRAITEEQARASH